MWIFSTMTAYTSHKWRKCHHWGSCESDRDERSGCYTSLSLLSLPSHSYSQKMREMWISKIERTKSPLSLPAIFALFYFSFPSWLKKLHGMRKGCLPECCIQGRGTFFSLLFYHFLVSFAWGRSVWWRIHSWEKIIFL